MGVLTGVPMLLVDFRIRQCRMSLSLIIPMSHVEFKKTLYPMSLSIKENMSHVTKLHGALSNSGNGHVATLILGVNIPVIGESTCDNNELNKEWVIFDCTKSILTNA